MQAMATGPVELRSGDPRVGSGSTDWRVELASHLASVPFPARQDELLAGLIRGRVPSRLLMRLACLPRTTRFSSAEAVLAFVAAATGEDGPAAR